MFICNILLKWWVGGASPSCNKVCTRPPFPGGCPLTTGGVPVATREEMRSLLDATTYAVHDYPTGLCAAKRAVFVCELIMIGLQFHYYILDWQLF